MAEPRPFPASPRRLALARRAGLHAASPVLVGGIACAAAALGTAMVAVALARRLGVALAAAASRGATGAAPPAGPGAPIAPAAVTRVVLESALPLLGLVALAAIAAHLAQTRAPWLPRRRVPDAPAVATGAGSRVRRATLELGSGATILLTAFAWLWLVAPRLAALPTVPGVGAAMIASALATVAIVWVALGVVDALVRHLEVASALRMTAREQRDDVRAAGLDPRWRARRAATAASARVGTTAAGVAAQVAGSTLLLLGDDIAVAIAWDPVRRPVPGRTASGRRAQATQLLALARRHQLPVIRDAGLAAALVGTDGPVPERHRLRLATIIASLPPRDGGQRHGERRREGGGDVTRAERTRSAR